MRFWRWRGSTRARKGLIAVVVGRLQASVREKQTTNRNATCASNAREKVFCDGQFLEARGIEVLELGCLSRSGHAKSVGGLVDDTRPLGAPWEATGHSGSVDVWKGDVDSASLVRVDPT